MAFCPEPQKDYAHIPADIQQEIEDLRFSNLLLKKQTTNKQKKPLYLLDNKNLFYTVIFKNKNFYSKHFQFKHHI